MTGTATKNGRDLKLQTLSRRGLRSAEELTRRKVAIPHRRFGRTYWYQLEGSAIQEDGTDSVFRNVGEELPV
jgi:hypothetical protein